MKKLYFHVGSGRCGSTLIQTVFNDPQIHKVFADHKRQYDPQIYLDTGELAHEPTLVTEHWRPIKEQYFDPMQESEFDGFFITQENLLGMRPGKDEQNICDVSCDKIEYLADGFETYIIIVLRRQDTYIESLYNMAVKRWEKRGFETYLADFPLQNWHWADNIDVYRDRFGADRVKVLPLEHKIYQDVDYSGMLDAVLMAAGVTTRLGFQGLPIINPSLAPRAIEVQRIANERFSKEEALMLADWLSNSIKKMPDDPHGLLSDEKRAEILAYFRETNTRLCDEYLTDFPSAKAYYTGEEQA